MAPTKIEAVSASLKSPNKTWPSAAEATSGTACTRSVPTNSDSLKLGYSIKSMMIISEPDPTEVRPTIRPPAIPISNVGSFLT
jgi:hypothetical protein